MEKPSEVWVGKLLSCMGWSSGFAGTGRSSKFQILPFFPSPWQCFVRKKQVSFVKKTQKNKLVLWGKKKTKLVF